MSKVIDERVVEMRFDNQHFERNVQTTMSTLDKLKQKLNLGGAAKGLDEVNSAAKRIDMSGLGKGVEAVSAKFSALQVMGVTALANITNSAVNAGKRIASALTIEPVKTGFNEYELKMGSIQTIMASTGESLEVVNGYLNELNEYSDKTIYSFSDMTQNIGKFTNAGVKLEDAVMAIKGISNEAAISGANANEASRAMYNFAQALSAGYVKLIDWKSIENANMATVGFKDQLIEAAVAAGTLKKQADGMYKVLTTNAAGREMDEVMNSTKLFNESLNYQWMTTEVLVNTLKDYADETTEIGKKATQAATEVKTYTQMMDSLKESAQSGWAQTWELIFGDFNQGKTLWTNIYNVVGGIIDKMSDARNSMLKGALGSTWDRLSDKIEKAGFSVEDFNKILKQVLKKSGIRVETLIEKYGSLSKAIEQGGIHSNFLRNALRQLLGIEEETAESIDKITLSAEELEKVVKRVMSGEFGDGADRMKKLAEAGYDYATVQNRINEILGSSVRHTSDLTDSQKEQIASLSKLTDEQLKNKDYTEEQIEALRDLEKMTKLTGDSFDDLMKKMNRPSGRELLLDSFKNMWTELQKIFDLIGEAWTNVFGETTDEERAEGLYNLIEAFHDLTESMTISEEAGNNFRRILEGIFSALDLSWSLASASFMGGLKLLNEILKIFGTDVVSILADLADLVTKFNDWVEIETIFGSSTKWKDLAQIIVAVYEGVRDCAKAFLSLEKLQPIIGRIKTLFDDLFGVFDGNPLKAFTPENIVKAITDFFDNIEAWIKNGNTAADLSDYIIEGIADGLKTGIGRLGEILSKVCSTVYESIADFFGADTEFRDMGGNVISGLIKGMSDGIQSLIGIAAKVFTAIYDTIANLFQIHSPSKVMIALGGFIIAGLISGLLSKNGELEATIGGVGSMLIDGFKNLLGLIVDGIKEIDLGDIVAVGLSSGLIFTVKKLSDVLEMFGNPLKKLGGLFDSITKIFKILHGAVEQWAKAQKYNAIGKMVLNMAIALGILVGAVIALCWAINKLNIDWPTIGKAAAIIGGLAIILGVLALACTKLNDSFKVGKNGLDFGLKTASIVGIALSLALMALAFKMLADIDAGDIVETLILFTGMIVGIGGLLFAVSKITENLPAEANIKGIGKIFTKLAISLLIMIGVIKLASMLTVGEIVKGTIVIGLIGMFYKSILKVLGNIDPATAQHANNFGKLAKKLSVSLLLMIGVIKLASMLEWSEIAKGSVVIAGIGIMFGIFIKFAKSMNKDAGDLSKVGSTLLMMSAALILTTLAVKMVAGMSPGEITKGIIAVGLMSGLFAGLMYMSKFTGQNAAKAGAMLIEVSIAMLLMVAVLIILKDLDPEGIGKAMSIIAGFTILFGGLIAITKFAGSADKIKGTLITLTVAIGILAITLVALSFLDSKKVAIAAGALSAVIGMFALLIKATSNISTGKKTWTRSLLTIGVLALLVGLLAGLIKQLADLEPKRALGASGSLGILLLSLSGALMIISHSKSLSKKNLGNMLITLGVLTTVIFALTLAIGCLKDVDPLNALGSATALGILLNALASAFLIITHSKSLSKKNMDGMLATIAILGLVTIALSVAIAILKNVDPLTAIGSAVALGILLNALSSSLLILSNSKSISKSKLPNLLITLGMLTLVVGALGVVISKMNGCNPLTSVGNAVALSILLTALSTSLNIISRSKSINKSELPGIIATLSMLTLAVGVMGEVIKRLSDCDPQTSIGNAIALGLLLSVLSIMTIPLSAVGKNAKNAAKGALALSSMVIPLITFGVTISKLPPISEAQVDTVEVLTQVMIAMGALMVPLALLGKFTSKALMGMGGLTAMCAPLYAFGFTISKIPEISDAQVNAVKMLTQVMIAMTALMIPLAIIGNFAVQAAFGMACLLAMCVPLYTFAFTVSKFPKISEGQITAVQVLTKLMGEMSLLLLPLTVIGTFAISAALGIAALTAMVIPLKTFAKAIVELPDVSGSMMNIVILMSVMQQVTDILAKISSYGFDAVLGVSTINSMINIIKKFGSFATVLGFLMDKIPSLETFVNKGMGVLQAVGDGLGRVMGSFIGGFGEEVTSSLPVIGENLTAFAEGISGFVEKIKMVDESVLTGSSNLAKAIMTFVGADLLSGLTSLVSFGDSGGLKSFGAELAGFVEALGPFIEGIAGIDASTIDNVSVLSDAILALTKADLISSISAFLGAKLDLSDFGTQLKGYGEGIAEFYRAITGEGVTLDENVVKAAKTAGEIMVELQKSIEPLGGVLQFFKGEKDLDNFGNQLKQYGSGLVDFSKTVSEEDAIDADAVESAKNAGLAMTAVQKAIPEDKVLDGKANLSQFGEKVAKFGEHIKTFSGHVSEINIEKVKASTDAAKSLVSIARSASGLDKDEVANFASVGTIGSAMKIYGEAVAELDPAIVSSSITSAGRLRDFINTLTDLDNSGVYNFNVVPIGDMMGMYVASVGDMDPGVVSSSITCANRLKNFIASLVDLDSSGISNFRIGSIGQSIKNYAHTVSGIDSESVSLSISAAKKLASFISGLAGMDASGVSSFVTSISKLGTVSIDEFVDAFSGSADKLNSVGGNMISSIAKGVNSKKSTLMNSVTNIFNGIGNLARNKSNMFVTIGQTLMRHFTNGITKQKTTVISAASSNISAAIKALKNYHSDFYNAGSYLAEGFANGIADSAYAAVTAAAAMAAAAKEAAEEALGINSPSKEFYAIGRFAGMGLVNALKDYGRNSYKAGAEVATQAKSGLSDAIGRISDLINSDIDSQPVIRPVLDLSDIQSGAGAINGLFGMTPSVGVMSNVRAINSMMSRSQNGGSAEIVSAIDKLRGDLGNLGGDTYQINGITYGADSEVSSAIQTLVRAMNMERRI